MCYIMRSYLSARAGVNLWPVLQISASNQLRTSSEHVRSQLRTS